MTHEDRNLEEQVVSKAAEMTLSSQLDSAEKIEVDVQTNLSEIIQGKAEGMTISGQGLLMQKDIRIQEMEWQTNGVDINPLSALFGQIELDRPFDANGRIVLTEPDLNRALNSNYVLSKAQNYELNVDGKTVTVSMQQMELHLPDGDQMVFIAKSLIREMENTRQLGFTATFRPRSKNQPLLVENFQCHDGQSTSIDFAVALLGKIKEVAHLPYIEMGQMRLRVEEMEVQPGKITLQVQAHIRQIPSS